MRRLVVLIILIIFLSGCTTQQKTNAELAEELCVKKCQEAISNHQDLSNGPCLSNEIVKDWVCDVVHYPRIEKDNYPQNQCDAFRAGAAHNFVEVDTECNVIKVY